MCRRFAAGSKSRGRYPDDERAGWGIPAHWASGARPDLKLSLFAALRAPYQSLHSRLGVVRGKVDDEVSSDLVDGKDNVGVSLVGVCGAVNDGGQLREAPSPLSRTTVPPK